MSCVPSSTTLTFAPSASYTQAISRPMMPPPITSRRFGMPASSSAPVESMMRGSSGMNGSFTASEPAAMMQLSKPMSCLPPSDPVTSMTRLPANLPMPRTTSTLRCLARTVRPPVRRLTTLSFQLRNLSMSSCGAPNEMPCAAISWVSSITFAACSSAFEGMQPTFRHTPPRMSQRSISATFRPRSAARNAAV